MALAMEDKEGHCLFLWVQGCILGRGCVDYFTFRFFLTVILKQFLAITNDSGIKNNSKKLFVCIGEGGGGL